MLKKRQSKMPLYLVTKQFMSCGWLEGQALGGVWGVERLEIGPRDGHRAPLNDF
jgi:hypothetical protein